MTWLRADTDKNETKPGGDIGRLNNQGVFSQWIQKIQMFSFKLYFCDFSGNRRLLAVFGASFRVFWVMFGSQLSALIFFQNIVSRGRKQQQKQVETRSARRLLKFKKTGKIIKFSQMSKVEMDCCVKTKLWYGILEMENSSEPFKFHHITTFGRTWRNFVTNFAGKATRILPLPRTES